MNPRVKELLTTLEITQKELWRIRENCPHPSYSIGFIYMPKLATSRVCNECKAFITGITYMESLKQYFNHFFKMR